jgi:hypothetical protein
VRAARATRTDWRDGLSTAADLALVGIAVTVAALPVVTAGAALRTGSVAVRRLVEGERVPPLGDLWRIFRRSLLPGLAAAVVVLAVAGLLLVDLAALTSGRVPGGPIAVALTGFVSAALAALAGLTVAQLGRAAGIDADGRDSDARGDRSRDGHASDRHAPSARDDRGRDGHADGHAAALPGGRGGAGGWLAAVRWAARTALRRPGIAAAVAGVLALAVALAVLVPVTAPLVVGFTLYAIHVVARRA